MTDGSLVEERALERGAPIERRDDDRALSVQHIDPLGSCFVDADQEFGKGRRRNDDLAAGSGDLDEQMIESRPIERVRLAARCP